MKRAVADEGDKVRRRRKRPAQSKADRPDTDASERETDSSDDAAPTAEAGNGDSKSDPNKVYISSSSSAAPETESSQPDDVPGGTYPNPATFAERVMHVLENEIAPQGIWWVDGEAIALHPENTKSSRVLANYFHGNRFATFVRTLTRWGFKRVTHFNLSEPAIVLHNSLFRRDKPHLVHHMMMDSDVQDIFAEHQKSIGQQSRSSALTEEGSVSVATADPEQTESPSIFSAPSLKRQAVGSVQGAHLACPRGGATSSIAAAPPAPVSSLPPPLPPIQGALDPSLIALGGIIKHSRDFLNLTSPNNANVVPLRTLVQLLLVEGTNHVQCRQKQQQQIGTTEATAQQLSQQFMQKLASQLASQPLPQQPTGGLNDLPQVMSLYAQLQPQLQQQFRPPQQQPQPQGIAIPEATAIMLQQMFQRQTGQQQPHMANQAGQTPGSSTVAAFPQLQQIFAQQQQQQQQHHNGCSHS